METQSLICASWASEPINASLSNPDEWLVQWARGGTSDAGIAVNAMTALEHTPLWHAIQILGGDCGSLPMDLKRVRGDSLFIDRTHVAYKLLNVKPSRYMCPNTWFELAVLRATLYGNFVCEIPRDGAGRPMLADGEGVGGINPLPPETTQPEYDDAGELWITTRLTYPDRTQEKFWLRPENTFHVKGLTTDGFWGVGLITVAKNRIANGLGYLKHSNATFANAAKPDMLFSFPGRVNQESLTAFQGRLQEKNVGLSNRGRNLVVDQGMTATPLSMTLEDAVFSELVKLDRQMVAALFGIPAVMLNADEKASFSNNVEMNLRYINQGLGRWQNKFIEEAVQKLLVQREQDRYLWMWDNSRLLRSTGKEQAEEIRSLRASKIITSNEGRRMRGLNPSDEEGADLLENPFTGSNENPTDDSAGGDPESAQNLARSLKRFMKREDDRLLKATREHGNFVDWMDNFYKTNLLNELSDLAPGTAEKYCSDRHNYWLTVAGAVNSMSCLQDVIKAQHSTQGGRVATLLNGELLCDRN